MKKDGYIILIVIFYNVVLIVFSLINPAARLVEVTRTEDIIRIEKQLKWCRIWGINSKPYYSKILCNCVELANLYPLEVASGTGKMEIVRKFLKYGADVNVCDPTFHSTPLLCALSSGSNERFQIAWLLIENGADINVVDDRNKTALSSSVIITYKDTEKCRQEGLELFIYLVEHCDTDLIYRYNTGKTLIECAGSFDNISAVEYLLENDYFGINDISEEGTTVLHVAAKRGSVNVCRYLLEHDADKEIKDSEGMTAYDYALEKEQEQILELLK